MSTEIFYATNVKCMGCVKSIKEGLSKLKGIVSVEVILEEGKVTVVSENVERNIISTELHNLGYPEKKKTVFSFFK